MGFLDELYGFAMGLGNPELVAKAQAEQAEQQQTLLEEEEARGKRGRFALDLIEATDPELIKKPGLVESLSQFEPTQIKSVVSALGKKTTKKTKEQQISALLPEIKLAEESTDPLTKRAGVAARAAAEVGDLSGVRSELKGARAGERRLQAAQVGVTGRTAKEATKVFEQKQKPVQVLNQAERALGAASEQVLSSPSQLKLLFQGISGVDKKRARDLQQKFSDTFDTINVWDRAAAAFGLKEILPFEERKAQAFQALKAQEVTPQAAKQFDRLKKAGEAASFIVTNINRLSAAQSEAIRPIIVKAQAGDTKAQEQLIKAAQVLSK